MEQTKSATINNVMATEEEERRRRLEEQAALAGLTPAYMEMLENQLARQRGEGGLDITPPLTKYAPLSGDRRSERTGLMRPVGNILDRLLRPGWQAEMNRRQRRLKSQRQAYAEQRPMQAAQQSALLTDSQLEVLKQKALDGDVKAQQLLQTYVRSLNPPRTSTGGDYGLYRQLAQEVGVAGIDSGGVAERIDGAPGGVDEADAVVEEPLTQGLSARRGGRERLLAQLRPRQLAAAERDLARLNKEISDGGSSGLNPRERFRAFSDEELLAKQAERTKVKNNIRSLEQEIARDQSRPSAGAGGPGQTGAAITQ